MTEEEKLVQRCRSQDREAQHEVYRRTSQRIYRLLLRMTGDADAAFDLAQETYVRAFTRIGQFDGKSALATWLYRIAVNEALQHLRRAGRAASRLTDDPARREAASPDTVATRLDVQAALARLTAIDRAMLLLRYQDGLDYAAIAEAVGCRPGTVASRLNRARGRLRELLADYDPEESVRPSHPIEAGRME